MFLLLLLWTTGGASATTLYVSLQSTNPVPPYSTWATAATNIQDAVDVAKAGDTVRVTNGVYAVGSRDVLVLDTNRQPPQLVSLGLSRVVVTNAIRLESVNGPLVTTVDGGWDGLWWSGIGVRCLYLGTNAVLSGFTLTKGVASHGGGLYCEVSGVVTNCTLTGNLATRYPELDCGGGGACGGTLYNCTLTSNVAYSWFTSVAEPTEYDYGDGGGAYGSILYNCTLSGNSAGQSGGGAYGSTLYNCTLTGNYSALGEGYGHGGGAFGSILYNCTLTGNLTGFCGGGAFGSTLYNCTLSGNSTRYDAGGGASSSVLFNSVVYGNTNGNYSVDTVLNYCLTTPLPTNGIGNIAADPRFVNAAAGDFRLRPDSPCIDAGTNLLGPIVTDIDGEFRPWDGNRDGVAAFDIGAYEFRPSPATLYVSLQSTNPVPPYSTWATAATTIQDAVDVAKAGDTVRVMDGVYAAGSRGTHVGESRVVVTNTIRLESVNGPLVTTVDGGWDGRGWSGTGVRCVYLATNAVLSGFTIRNGWASWNGWGSWYGGGVYCEASGVVTNCTLTHNVACGSVFVDPNFCATGAGGGAYGGTLYNCTLTGNGSVSGGGAYGGTLYNCTLSGNWIDGEACYAGGGSGVGGCTLYNCTVAGNSDGGASYCTLDNCTVTGNAGGGTRVSTLYNCMVTGNSDGGVFGSTLYNCMVADNAGCGANDSTLYNCTVTGNHDGGVISLAPYHYYSSGGPSTVYNSIVYYNSGGNYDTNTTLNYCCTTPLPTNGVGNITGPPLFMDYAAGDYRLWEGSPCIDAGTNLMGFPMMQWMWWQHEPVVVGHITDPTDILGNTRLIDGDGDGRVAWDIGAYEFNSYKPPRFSHPPRLTVNGWELTITGAHNKWVRVQCSSDLQNWGDLRWWNPWLWMGSEGVKQVNDWDTGQRMRFYRVVVQ